MAHSTPRKATSGLQQLGGNSGAKPKKEEIPAPDTVSLEIRAKMQTCTNAIEAHLEKYASGMHDSARGRVLQGIHRQWGDHITTAKRLIKGDGMFEEKRVLQLRLQQLEATMGLMKVVVKTSASYLETASFYDTLKLIEGIASEGVCEGVSG